MVKVKSTLSAKPLRSGRNPYISDWVVETGVWRDLGQWIDTAIWMDA